MTCELYCSCNEKGGLPLPCPIHGYLPTTAPKTYADGLREAFEAACKAIRENYRTIRLQADESSTIEWYIHRAAAQLGVTLDAGKEKG